MNHEPPSAAHILVFESDPRGHAQEWLEHLIGHVAARPAAPRLSILVAAELADELAGHEGERVRVLAMTPRERRLCSHPKLAVSGFAKWSTMRRRLRETGATEGLFLCIDHLSLPLGLGLPMAGRPVSGVLFRPTDHYRDFGCRPESWGERLRDLRKWGLTLGMLRNPAVSRLLTIDPYFPEHARRYYPGGDKVVAVGDPAHPPPAPSADERAVADEIPDDRTAFVLFGELTERKGVLPLLDAVARLPADTAATAAVILAGRVDPPIRRAVNDALAAARKAHPELWLKLVDRRLAMGEITALVERSNAVLVPYQRFVGSSGVLMWAAQLRRPVVCQDYGLLGELTRRFGLGTTVDSRDPAALADMLGRLVRNGTERLGNPAGQRAFLASRSAETFVDTLLYDDRAQLRTGSVAASHPDDTERSQRFPV
jgi:glycosyltransferase involved in cell wall biosynthesis